MSEKKSHKVYWVKNLYLYGVSIIAIMLIAMGGVFGLVKWGVKNTVFDKYYLESFEEERCTVSYNYPSKVVPDQESGIKKSDAQIAQEKLLCEQSLEKTRKYRQVMDLVESVSQLVIGLLLFVSHFVYLRPKWEKQERE